MKQTVLIVAGGSGLRMGGEIPKQFLEICGRPVLFYTFEVFMKYNADIEFVLVIPELHIPLWASLVSKFDFAIPHTVVAGGRTRFHSVKNGLSAIDSDGLVAIHDGVRPFVSVETIERAFHAADHSGAAIPVLPVIESLRYSFHNETYPIDRGNMFTVQTPQVFNSALIKQAYELSFSESFTDDATVVEKFGHAVELIEGNRENIKITTPFDIVVAEALVQQDQ